jgi:ethanolamine utilization protein EutQ
VGKKRVITPELVAAEAAAGRMKISAARGEAVITPGAWTKAHELGVLLDQSGAPVSEGPSAPGSSERSVDASGVVLVRGRSVMLGRFPGAGPDRNVGLHDLISGKDKSPMTAGIMSWSKADSFPWSLDYDEIDFVMEGTLALQIDGRTIEGRPGDVLYIPKGSKVVFGTPGRVRVFYVTYPADWSAAPLARPNR